MENSIHKDTATAHVGANAGRHLSGQPIKLPGQGRIDDGARSWFGQRTCEGGLDELTRRNREEVDSFRKNENVEQHAKKAPARAGVSTLTRP